MLNLTTTIAIPNITRLRVARVEIDDVNLQATITVEARSAAGANLRYGTYTLVVSDTLGYRLRTNPISQTYGDAFIVDTGVATPSAYTHILTALTQANPYNKVELLGVADGWLGATLAGT